MSGQRVTPRGGVPELVGYGPVDPGLIATLLTDPHGLPVGFSHLTVRRVLTDRTGQAVATDDRALPLRTLLTRARTAGAPTTRAGSPGVRTTGVRTIGCRTTGKRASGALTPAALLGRLLTDLPAPPPRVERYRPTPAQSRTVLARDTSCQFPGCPNRATSSELDHRRPYPAGPTTVANLHPLCKHHHRLKHDGWTARRAPDGTTTWTSPRGQRKKTIPT